MDPARQVTIEERPTGAAQRVSVVTPQLSRGTMPTSEEMNDLVRAVANGDRQAFVVLFNHFAPRITAYLMRGGTSAGSAEELAQEAMVLLWRKAGSFDPARGAVSTWIFTIARHLRIDRHRRDGDENLALDLDGFDPADSAATPDEHLDALQRERRVRAALRRLSPDQARLLQLSFFAERPHFDIARELCLPLGTVKSHIRRGLKRLRRLLDAAEP